MAKIDCKTFCNHSDEKAESKFFRSDAKGGAAAFAAAYPTKDVIVASSCERAVLVSTDSFIRRPSLCDEAMQGIMTFVNEGVYAIQEPDRQSRCSLAAVFVFKGKARCATMGCSIVYYFSEGKLEYVADNDEDIMPRKILRPKFTFEPEFELKKGRNSFLIISGEDRFGLDASLLESALQSSEGAEGWIAAISSELKKYKCSALAVNLPPKKPGIADLLH